MDDDFKTQVSVWKQPARAKIVISPSFRKIARYD